MDNIREGVKLFGKRKRSPYTVYEHLKKLTYCGCFGFHQLPAVILGLMCNLITDFNKTKITMAKYSLNTGLVKIIGMVSLAWFLVGIA